jgi:uncharacterized membrane-anchored protein
MSVAQGYVFCGCLTAVITGIALLMIYMGVFRRGEAAELDDAAARMLVFIGIAVLVALGAVWALGLSDKIR